MRGPSGDVSRPGSTDLRDFDGNKRLALAGVIAFLGINGYRLTMSNDEAYELVMKVASGHLEEVEVVASLLRRGTRPRR